MTTYTGSTLAATVSRTTSSAGSFAAQTRVIHLPVPILFESYVMDIFKAGTYRFAIDGVTVVSGVVVGADNTNNVAFTPAAPIELAAGTHTLSVAVTSAASIRWHYNNVSTAAPSGTGADYLGHEQWQEATGNTCPGTYNFKVPDGVLKDILAPTSQSAASFTQQEWPVTFTDDVLLVGVGKRAYQNDATGYTLSIDGVNVATVVKANSQEVTMAFPVSPAAPLAAGARTFKIVAGSGVNKSWSYLLGGGASPVGDGYATTWGAWTGNSPQQPSARLFYVLALQPPTDLTADPSTTTADLEWTAPVTGGVVEGYEVRVDGGAPVDVGNVLTYTLSALTPGTTYEVEVRAYGEWDESDWTAPLEFSTVAAMVGYFRVELELGSHSWTIERGDPFAYGPLLPLSLGWEIADNVDFFPAQAGITTLSFMVQCQDASELADVVKGSTVTMRMYVDPAVDADVWQTFDGAVTQLDGEAVAPGTQARADAGELDFRVTVFAGDDNVRLADTFVGYTSDWPVEQIETRVQRICTEAGITYDDPPLAGLGMVGWLRDRSSDTAVSALDALRSSLKDAADDYDSEPPDHYYGRYVFMYSHADTTLYMHVFRRRVFPLDGDPPYPGATYTLDGAKVTAAGQWSKYPGPAAAHWVIVDGVTFGTPDATVPYTRSTSLFDTTSVPGDPVNHSATERDNLGESLLADGSTALDGWSSRSLRYLAYLAPDPVTLWASRVVESQATVVPVVITPLGAELELNGLDYLAGTLTGARLVIPAGGDYFLELKLRNELLPGTELPA